MGNKIEHKGLDFAEAIEHYTTQANLALLQGRVDNFLDLIDCVIYEAESAKTLITNEPQFALANAKILICGINIRLMTFICETSISRKIDFDLLQKIKEATKNDLINTAEFLKQSMINDYQDILELAEEKLNRILDRYSGNA